MKKLFILSVLVSAFFVSCSPRIVTTSTDLKITPVKPVITTDVMADLEVMPNKISFFYIPSNAVAKAGISNVVESAIREALLANGNADVLVGVEKQFKLTNKGKVESITVTGYPAYYKNWRVLDEEYILNLTKMYQDVNLKMNSNPCPDHVPNLFPTLNVEQGSSAPEDAPMLPFKKRSRRK